MADVTPGSPLWWLDILEQRLIARRHEMQKMDAFYRGDHPLPFLTDSHEAKMRDEFRRMLEESRSNFCRLVVDAVEERLSIDSFSGPGGTSDTKSWDIWEANGMEAASQVAFLESLTKGVSYLSVWEDIDEDGLPDIAVEDPLETIVAYEPGSNFRRRSAAAKLWVDDITGETRANVYLPDRVVKFRSTAQAMPIVTATSVTLTSTRLPGVESRWELLAEGAEIANPLGVVPIIPLRNRPRLLGEGESELADVWRTQSQINGFLFLLALAGYFGAHKQRWASGLTIMEDGNGKPVEPFNSAVDRLFVSENADAKFGEFGQTNLSGYIAAIEQKVLHIAVTTRTPRHYLIEQGQSPSGDAIRSAESGLVKKVLRKQRSFAEGIEEAMMLARRLDGDASPERPDVVWTSAQTDVEAALTDAVLKQLGANLIDQHTALTKLGYSKSEATSILSATAGKEPAQPDPNALPDGPPAPPTTPQA